jgi:hypothetical protein
MSSLSVVIVNYNTCADLHLCLRALGACEPAPEIIVVDNASRDGSVGMVRAEFPGVRLLAMEQNTWFCGGNNRGIAASTGDYVLLLNPDTIPAPDSLNKLVAFLDTHADYTGVTAQLRYPDGCIQRTCSRAPTYAYLLLMHTPLGWGLRAWRDRLAARHWYADWDRETDYDVAVMPGSCTLMRRRDLWLDDRLRLYFPEDDLARRLRSKCRYLADAQIIHREKSVTQSWLATRIYFRDMLVYTRQHHGPLALALLWLLSRPLLIGLWLKRKGMRDEG